MTERLMKPREVANVYGISYDTVCYLMRAGQIASIPIGKTAEGPRARLATTASRVERWLANRETAAQIAREPERKKIGFDKRAKRKDPPEGAEYGPDGRLRIKRR